MNGPRPLLTLLVGATYEGEDFLLEGHALRVARHVTTTLRRRWRAPGIPRSIGLQPPALNGITANIIV